MTVKEKIQIKNGYISKPEAMDHSLKIKTQNLLWEYNNTRPDENEKRSTILTWPIWFNQIFMISILTTTALTFTNHFIY